MSDRAARVEAGAAWLDETVPNWERRVDDTMLDLASGCNCILGQVFKVAAAPFTGYEWATRTFTGYEHYLPVASGWAVEHGFLVDKDETAEELDDAWLDLMDTRRRQPVAVP